METIQVEILQKILEYLSCEDLWNVSLSNKFFFHSPSFRRCSIWKWLPRILSLGIRDCSQCNSNLSDEASHLYQVDFKFGINYRNSIQSGSGGTPRTSHWIAKLAVRK